MNYFVKFPYPCLFCHEREATAANMAVIQNGNALLNQKYGFQQDPQNCVCDDYTNNRMTEYAEKYVPWELPERTLVEKKMGVAPMALSRDALDASKWGSEQNDKYRNAMDSSDTRTAGVPLDRSAVPNPNFYAWSGKDAFTNGKCPGF